MQAFYIGQGHSWQLIESLCRGDAQLAVHRKVEGDVGGSQLGALREDECALNEVAQFSHVTLPVFAQQGLFECPVDALHLRIDTRR